MLLLEGKHWKLVAAFFKFFANRSGKMLLLNQIQMFVLDNSSFIIAVTSFGCRVFIWILCVRPWIVVTLQVLLHARNDRLLLLVQ